MTKAELSILDATLENAIKLERFSAGEKAKVLKILTDLQRELKAKLALDLTDFGKARVKKLLKEATAIIDGYYGDIQGKIDLSNLAKIEATATASTFATIGLEAAIPTEAVLRALVSDTLLQGAPLKAWWAKQADDLAFRYGNAVRQGITQGETLQQIIVRVFGSKRLGTPGVGFPDSILRRNASALVHDSIMSVSGAARMAVYEANQDIMKGYYWLSTLDGIICVRCVARSGAQWDLDFKPINGTTVPFVRQGDLHVNCRCLVLPILKSYAELGAPDIQEPPKGTRASDLGQVDADLTFSGFLKRHSAEYQNELLGPGRAAMWRKGTITLQDLLNFQGNPLTLKQLSAKYKP